MFDLIPAPLPAPGALTVSEIDLVRAFAEAEKAASTRVCYERDWRIFRAWCAARMLSPLPSEPATVAAFLAAQAQAGVKASSIGRRVSSVRYAHKLAGFTEPPTNTELVKATLRGIRRTLGTAPDQKAPATASIVGEMLRHCPDTLIGTRDRALLALGFAGAFRRSELVALQVEDLTEVPDGLRVLIRHSKTDQEGQGQEIAILRGVKICPVEAVMTWLARAEISTGLVFRSVLRGSRLTETALPTQCVALIVKKLAHRAGLDPKGFAGHSLRAGFCTSAAEHGASIFKMMDVSRHKSVDTLRGYVRRADSFKDHAGAAFLGFS
jgi:site-specific recombinase XerD